MAEWHTLLVSARQRLNLSQANLASRAHISLAAVKAYEQGKRHPSRPYLIAMLDAMKLEIMERNTILDAAGYSSDARDVMPGLDGLQFTLESAQREVDRASWWRRFSTITFPYIRSLLLLAVLFRTIETFKLFDIVYIITQGGPGSATETIGVYVYRVAFQNFRTSQSTALAYIVLFVVIVLTSLYLYAVNRRNQEAA